MEDLKEKVFNGELAIFDVCEISTGKKYTETLDGENITDLLIEPNAERMSDLTTLYNGDDIVIDDCTYRLIVGYRLISELIVETAEFMSDAVVESMECEEEHWDEYINSEEIIKNEN